MQTLWSHVVRWQIWRDQRGQDLIEYSLMLAFGAVAVGAMFPPLAKNITTIFSKLSSMIADAATY